MISKSVISGSRNTLFSTMIGAVAVMVFATGLGANEIAGQEPLGGAATWTPRGPAPSLGGQSEGITNNPVSGAVHAVAPHPTNADILYIATVNGGIWKTTNATNTSPTWTNQTDNYYTLSASDIVFDPTDMTGNTLVAGFGRFSSFGRSGGARGGLLRTTNGGANWTELASATFRGKNVAKVTAFGTFIMAAVDFADTFNCNNLGLFRSTDAGASFGKVASGLPGGALVALEADPLNLTSYFAAVDTFSGICNGGVNANGIYKSLDFGSSWVKVSSAPMDALIPAANGTGNHVEIAVGRLNNVYVALVPRTSGQLGGVFRSGNAGGTWIQMDLPETFEIGNPSSGNVGIHPGGQGDVHMSLVADPNNSNLVYIGGDRQPLGFQDTGSFPNSIGAVNFSGRLFRGNAGSAPGSQWATLTHSGTTSNSSPHADSRDMAFDANGNIIESDDGGVFRRVSPTLSSGDWVSLNGALQITEHHSMDHDGISNIIIVGNQDNGSSRQNSFASTTWSNFGGGDGGDVAIDMLALAGSNQSIRYGSSQYLQGIRRLTYNASNGFLGSTNLALSTTSGTTLVTGDPANGGNVQFTTPLATNQVAGSRLIIGATNSVYESLDLGATVSELAPNGGLQATSGGARSIAYGASGNADLLYVAGQDGLYLRTTGGGALTRVYIESQGRAMQGVSNDPTDASQAFAIELDRVIRTTNTGGNWTNITGNLGSFSTGSFRSILFVLDSTGDDLLVLGADKGVYVARASGGFTTWSSISSGLPNVPIYDLRYDPTFGTAIAGSFGRGSFSTSLAVSRVCEPLVTPADGALFLSNGGVYPSIATYSCNQGFELTASATRQCQTDFSWDGVAPSCVPLTCDPLTAPADGALMISNGGLFPSTATYSCNVGFELSGPATRQCQTDASWSGVAPSCDAIVAEDQTITFATPNDQLTSTGSLLLEPTASSGLPVSLSSDTSGVCIVSGSTIFFGARGSCSIRASQAGNIFYNAAPDVLRTFSILEPTMTSITMTSPPFSDVQSPYTVSVSVSSIMPVLRNFAFTFGTGIGATAVGNILFDEALAPNPGRLLAALPDPSILGLSVTVSGASAGNGSFGRDDFTQVVFDTNASALDFDNEMVGQPTTGDAWGTPSGSGGDFNLFSAAPPPPTGTFFFSLSANAGGAEQMILSSMTSAGVISPATPTGSILVSADDGSSCVIAALVAGAGSCEITPQSNGLKTLTADLMGTDFFQDSSGMGQHVVGPEIPIFSDGFED